MRTKFLTPDYFTTAKTLDFLCLPLSPITPSTPLTADFGGELFRFAADSSSSTVSLELENLPVDDALSKFYSDVLPHIIEVDHGDSPATNGNAVEIPEKGGDICYSEDTESSLTTQCESLDNQYSEERKDDTRGDKIHNGPEFIQFEIPELSQDVENACMSEKENNLFLSEIQAHDDHLETLNLAPLDEFGFDSKDSINSVETICLEHDMAQGLQMPEDVDLLPKNGHLCDTMFPVFEVDETGPADFSLFCVEDEWHSLLATIKKHHSACHYDFEFSCQDLFGSVKIDILELVSDCHTSKYPVEVCLTSLNLTEDVGLLELIETPYSESNIGVEDSSRVPFAETFLFEEFEMLNSDPFDIFEALTISQTTKESDTCEQLFNSYQQFKSFDELIVSPELAIVDGMFTSLPVPVMVDDEKIWSVEHIFDSVFSELEQLPFSTSDEIYLDWHLLGNDKCNDHVNAAIEKVFNVTEDYTISYDLGPNDCGKLVLELLLSEEPLDKLNTREDKLDMPSGLICTGKQRLNRNAPKRLLDDDCQIIESGVKIPKAEVEKTASSKLSDDDDCQIIESHQVLADGDLRKVASPFKPIPQVNDLDFFLNPRKASAGMRTDQRLKAAVSKSMLFGGVDKKAAAAEAPSRNHMQSLIIQRHRVMLPDGILILIGSLRRSYLAIFRENLQLSKTEFVVTNSDDINLLRLPEQTLMDQLCRSSEHKSSIGHRDVNDVMFITLCAIKRMAWCLCFYGIENLHLFLCKLFQRLPFLRPRLLTLYSLVEDANAAVNKDITKSHPSLATIKGILGQNSIRKGKILILAQQEMWGPLKKLSTSMNIFCTEVDLFTGGYQSDFSYDLFAGGLRDHSQTACVLVKHEHISPFILMQKFDLIVEYGGPCGVSRVSTLYPEHTGSQTLHFVKIELDDVARALCEGVSVPSGETDTIKLDELLNFGPHSESSRLASTEASAGAFCDSLLLPICQTAQESKSLLARNSSFPDMVIVVNTENFDKEMIISRRSTYQKILSMEKKGANVVERDLMLPVDIILDAVTCIVWYDCKNIGKKATAEDEGSSSIPLCIENIATNVLTTLSFTFTACVLVFEGDSNFLGVVMESADELYAAAASLGTDLQIFCSYSSELTDEIILNYIGKARKFSKGLLPRLPETETHAESFLTKFPSINPLSAHAIISCGCMLVEFLEWSSDCRIHALREYSLPEESVSLLSALIQYGEREETKSGLTDCSSSVSSPPDSENFVGKVNSLNRKRKFIPNSSDAMYDFNCYSASDKCIDAGLNYYGTPSDSKASKSPRISLQKKLPDFVLDDKLFGEGGRAVSAADMEPYKPWAESNVPGTVNKHWPEVNVPGTVKAPKLGDEFAKSTSFVHHGFAEHKLGRANENKREEFAMDILRDLHEDFAGEVVNIYDRSPFGVDFQAAKRAVNSSLLECETVEDHASRSSKAARKLSFDSRSHFPAVDDMNISCGLEDDSQLRADNDYNGVDYNWDSNGYRHQQDLIGTGLFEKSIKNFRGRLPKEKFVPSYGETPLSKAVHSAQPQQGSPWTIEFLNRIKEKRRLRQQNQPWDTSVPLSGNSGNISKATKRRSPSILEYYKYQGGTHGSTPRKSTPQKLQRQLGQLSNEKPSGLRPSWTPVDKRARRSLSFATNGAGGQTKLVWSNNNSCSQDNRFSNM